MSGDGTLIYKAGRSTPPSAPATGYKLYPGDDGQYRIIDSGGVVKIIGGGGSTIPVRNETGVQLDKGSLVYVSGFSVAESRPLVDLADRTVAAKRPAVGMLDFDIPDNSNGDARISGNVTGLDTSSFLLTAQLSLGTGGQFVLQATVTDGELQNIGQVTRVDAVNGRIAVILDGLIPANVDELDALVGTNGTPTAANPYVTDSDPRNSDARTPTAHAASHQNGGSDEINVAGLSGLLADPQTAAAHAASHLPSGGDPLTTAAPAATGVSTASAEGTAESFARSDHAHQSNTAPVNVTKAAAAIGTSGEPARADHKHDVTTAAAVELTDSTNAEGAATSLARSNHTHAHGNRGGGSLHADVVAGGASGFMDGTRAQKLDRLGTIIKSHVVYADQMGVSNIDFPVNNIAPTDLDNTNSRFPVVVYDDTLEQIRWWGADSPAVAFYGVAANRLHLKILMKPETAPPAARTVGLRLYYSNAPDNAAVPAWRSIDLDDFDIADNINWQDQLFTLTIGGGAGQLDITAGQSLLLGIARINPTAGTELVGNAHMLRVVEGWGVS